MQTPMDRANHSWFLTHLAHWRARVLGGSVVLCGLALNLAVLGSNPVAQLAAGISPAAVDLAPDSEAVTPDTAAPLPADVDVTSVLAADDAADPILDVVPISGAAAGSSAGASPVAMVAAGTRQTAVAPQSPQASPQAPTPTTAAPVAAAPVAAAQVTAAQVTAAQVTAAPVTAAQVTAAPVTAAPTTAPPTTAVSTTAALQIEYLTYTVEDGVGSVVLAREGNSISLYGFYPNGGWIKEVALNGPSTVKLKFFNVQTERDHEWKATIQGGRIQVEN